MKLQPTISTRPTRAFSLMELLVVIGIIAVLAAMIFPVTGAIKANAARSRAKTELKFIASAIENYKQQLGHYPPDNPGDTNHWVSQLYYELSGTMLSNNVYYPPSGQGAIAVGILPTFLDGTAVTGFVNTSRGTDDDRGSARNFLTGLKPTHYLLVTHEGAQGMVLGMPLPGPADQMLPSPDGTQAINPWRYRISGPYLKNQEGYDLWIDLVIKGKTNRVSNWSDTYEEVP